MTVEPPQEAHEAALCATAKARARETRARAAAALSAAKVAALQSEHAAMALGAA
eukprot:SAG11_NODE_1906_length_4084_cov_31.351568_1_plen_53_part_10